MRKHYYFFLLFLLCSVLNNNALGQEADSLPAHGIFDLLINDKATEIEIEADLNDLLLKSKKTNDYLEATFNFELDNKETMTLPVKVRGRGRYRRMKCQFPPLKLKFRKDDLQSVNLNEFNELKLVTHCLDESMTSKELVWREYLVYKLFNILTPLSFRTQLVRVTYQNTRKKPKRIKGWGILIEDSDELAYRIGGKKTDEMGIPDSCLNIPQERINSLFNYMIGNCDWDYKMVRNIEFIQLADTNIIVTPYDFDFAGLVAAPYARPNGDVGQTSIRDRVFMGNAKSTAELQPAIQVFLDKKEAILEEVDDHHYLSYESKEDIITYLNSFFEILEDKQKLHESLFEKKKEMDNE